MKLTVGIDVGGTSVKVTVHNTSGRLLSVGKACYTPGHPTPDAVEYRPDDILSAVEAAVAEAIRTSGADARSVVAVTTDTMVSGTVGIGADGVPTTAYTTTLDTRFAPDLDRMIAEHESLIRRMVGSTSPVVVAKAAWYRRTQPEAYGRTRVFVTAGGLVGMHLAGLSADEAFVEPTVLWAVGASDTAAGTWCPELVDALEVDADRLPRIVPSRTAVGGLARDVAGRVGLPSGTPVIAGMGDQMAGFLGAGIVGNEAVAGDSAGTYSVVGHRVDAFAPDAEGLFDVVPSPVDGGYVEQAVAVIGGGYTREWLRDRLGAGSEAPDDARLLDDLAAQVEPGADGLVFLPHLGGQSSPGRPWVHGGLLGLTWNHDRRHVARAFLEAMAFEAASALRAMHGTAPARVLGYGGGTRSEVANQIKADAVGLPYVSLGDIAPASFASAMLGAWAVGELDDVHGAISGSTAAERVYQPDAATAARYERLRADYAQAVEVAAAFRRNR